MQLSNFRHSDYPIIPVTQIARRVTDAFDNILPIVNVGDWTTLHLHCSTLLSSTAIGADKTSAVTVTPTFYQFRGNPDPSTNTQVPVTVGGRTFCVGASDQRTNIVASSLDVRLPVIAPFFDLNLWYPGSQSNVIGVEIGLWGSNEPSYVAVSPFPSGHTFNLLFAGDTILGSNNASYSDVNRGISVPALSGRNVELTNQMVGKGFFSYHIQDPAGGAINTAQIDTLIITKAFDDTTGNTMDQVLYDFPRATDAAAGGIPLTGFRQAVHMVNFSAVPLLWHWTAYPEFS